MIRLSSKKYRLKTSRLGKQLMFVQVEFLSSESWSKIRCDHLLSQRIEFQLRDDETISMTTEQLHPLTSVLCFYHSTNMKPSGSEVFSITGLDLDFSEGRYFSVIYQSFIICWELKNNRHRTWKYGAQLKAITKKLLNIFNLSSVPLFVVKTPPVFIPCSIRKTLHVFGSRLGLKRKTDRIGNLITYQFPSLRQCVNCWNTFHCNYDFDDLKNARMNY